MSNPLVKLAVRLHRAVVHLYPRDFRETFDEEMHATFLDGTEEAAEEGRLGLFLLRELADAPRALLCAHSKGWGNRLRNNLRAFEEAASSDDLPPAPPDGRTSWKQAGLELGLFVITGMLVVAATYLPLEGLKAGWQRDIGLLGRVIAPLTLTALFLGLRARMPRWIYPSLGLLMSYYGLAVRDTGLWIFLLVMLLATCGLAAAAILTDPHPSRLPVSLRRFGQSLSQDWTRLSLALYGAMPLVIIMAFDDSHFDNRTPYMLFSSLAMICGALVYCRSREKPTQMAALLAGLTLSICGAWLDKTAFAQGLMNWVMVTPAGRSESLWLLKLWFEWALLLLAPACLALLLRGKERLNRPAL